MPLTFRSWPVRVLTPFIRFCYPHGAVRRVWRGPLAGSRFEVINGMGLTYAMGRDHWHFQFLQSQIHPGMVIYDVGANCGQMALFFARATGPSGRVLAFEPVPENAARLRRNLDLNHLTQAEAFEVAVAADHQPKRFHMNSGSHTMGTLATTASGQQCWDQAMEVRCLTLDSLLDRYPAPHLLKIDVEGGGAGVLEGARRIVEEQAPLLYFELHAGGEDAPELLALRDLRDRLGYHFIGLDAPGDPLRPSWGHALWGVPSSAKKIQGVDRRA